MCKTGETGTTGEFVFDAFLSKVHFTNVLKGTKIINQLQKTGRGGNLYGLTVNYTFFTDSLPTSPLPCFVCFPTHPLSLGIPDVRKHSLRWEAAWRTRPGL